MAYSRTPTAPALHPGAAVLAWIFPGLGHMAVGQKRRGALIMAGLLLMIVTGLLVGGVDAVDRKNDRLWFMAQSLCGPVAFAADAANQRLVQPGNAAWVQEPGRMRRAFLEGDDDVLEQLDRVGLGRVNEMGTLFIALAGLMNLVVILDVLFLPKEVSG